MTEETCFKYSGYTKFNGTPREGKPAIPINSYKDQFREHMIRNEMWGVLSIPDSLNKYKKWELLLHHFIFNLYYVKLHI